MPRQNLTPETMPLDVVRAVRSGFVLRGDSMPTSEETRRYVYLHLPGSLGFEYGTTP
ncbi:hypothetical protein [Myxococcus sp. CA040A]|uniref:hypothetical protein n=1 Tax=Myxococcus sp. CA040A TaxID=2741738 RepID=UPI00157B83BD|nr:hypothetical protein [Myxococcus sp. CA040A]NTX05782.1 hypothetical protein [Myxococcus sp. CA040A]